MTREAGTTAIWMRIRVCNPVPDVLYSLQEDDAPLDPKRSVAGEPLTFDFPIGIAPSGKFVGKQVRREGKTRRFVYVRIGTFAGDCRSPWSRRMKIDIHDIAPAMIEQAIAGARLTATVNGTATDGSPACATIRPVDWQSDIGD